MRPVRNVLLLVVLSLASAAAVIATGSAWAGAACAAEANAHEQTMTFTVENMVCELCPVTVKKAMEGVEGVKSVSVDFETKTATVLFDSSLATPDAIAQASADAGYPAHPMAPGAQ